MNDRKKYTFTLVKFINLPDFDNFLLIRTSYYGFDEKIFESAFEHSTYEEKEIEFENNKRENLINAFAESISNDSYLVDIEYIKEVYNISDEKLFHQPNGVSEFDIFCVKHNDQILFGNKIDEPHFEELLDTLQINKKNIRSTMCRFITENDLGKAKYNRINLFK